MANTSGGYSTGKSPAYIANLEELEKVQKLSEKQAKELSDYRRHLVIKEAEAEKKLREDIQKELHDQEIKNLKDQGKHLEANAQVFKDKMQEAFGDATAAVETLSNVTGTITKQLDSTINNYVNKQQSMMAHLMGSGQELSSLNDTLQNALSTSSIVKQSAVYDKLYTLVNAGIVSNVEQRAFLNALADDINIIFDASNGSLTRLIRIQQNDLTANRLSIEYSLQKFLNQNYQTSEYIKDAFTNVSNSLLEMQSLMTSQNAVGTEAVIQSWLGSYYSAGASTGTVNSLAAALNALGSGDISNLGQGISNLVLMGVARAGLDYGDLLNGGLNANSTNRIMSGIATYLNEMGANDSNVVKSQLAKLFGINVSDIVAASNLSTVSLANSNISDTLLADYSNLLPTVTKISNVFENLMYTWGTNIASNDALLTTYKATELISDSLGSILSPYTASMFGQEVNLGALAKTAPLIPLLIGLIPTIGDAFSSLSNGTSATSIFNALAGSMSTVKTSSAGVSGSLYVANGSSSDIMNSTMSSATSNIDALGIASEGPTLDENVMTITGDVAIIRELLEDCLSDIKDDVNSIRYTATFSSAGSMAGAALAGVIGG